MNELAGRATINVKAKELGVDLGEGDKTSGGVIRRVKELEHLGYHFEAADASFDLIVLNQVIEHLEQPGRVVAELARVLRPGGRLLVATPNYGTFGWPLVEATYHRWFVGEFDAEENHVTRYRPASLREQLGASLVVEDVRAICASLILVGAARRPEVGPGGSEAAAGKRDAPESRR